MPNPIGSVPPDKRGLFVGAIAALIALIGVAVFSPVAKNGDDSPQETPTAPATLSEQPSAILASNKTQSSQPALADPETTAENATDLAAAGATPASPPTATISADSGAIEQSASDTTADRVAAATADSLDIKTKSSIDYMLMKSLSEQQLAQIASSSDPDVRRLSMLVNLVENKKTELAQTKEQLQTLQVKFNEQYQLARQKVNETERWRQEAKELESTMNQIIKDNNRDSEMLSKELERWRERALQAERENARLQSRRPTPTTTALQRLPETTSPTAPATTAPQPLPLRPLNQPSEPATNFTTTCYDPNQGYFTCTVRQ